MNTLLVLGHVLALAATPTPMPAWARLQSAILVQPDYATIREVIEVEGTDPNAPIGCGDFAPLDGAVTRGDPELVDLLLSLGAKPKERQLVQAAFCADHQAALRMVQALHQAGAPITSHDVYSPGRASNALHQAVWRNNTELVAWLLAQEGVPLDEVNIDGYTALMIAVQHGREEMVDLLLAAGANPLATNRNGLDAAAVADQVIQKEERIKRLLEPDMKGAQQ